MGAKAIKLGSWEHSGFFFPIMPVSLSRIIHHSHSFTRLEIYRHIYFIYKNCVKVYNHQCHVVLSSFNVTQMCRNYEKFKTYGCHMLISQTAFMLIDFIFISDSSDSSSTKKSKRESSFPSNQDPKRIRLGGTSFNLP